MFSQIDKSWRDYRSRNQNWSYQPTLAGRAITLVEVNSMLWIRWGQYISDITEKVCKFKRRSVFYRNGSLLLYNIREEGRYSLGHL